MIVEHRSRSRLRESMRRIGSIAIRGFAVVVLMVVDAHAADDPLPQTIDRVRRSIVAIGTNEPTRNPSFEFRGTGFAVADGTLIATNNHVLPASVDPTKREVFSVAVPLTNGEAIVREASVVARDAEHDIAILRLVGPPLPALRFADSTKVREGQLFALIGFPIGGVIGLFPATHRASISAITPVALTQPTARSLDPAMVQMLRRERFPIFQLDATVYPGNSGSPLFDTATGAVVGIVNSTLVKAGKESALTQPSGISYAIPSNYFAEVIEGIKRRPN